MVSSTLDGVRSEFKIKKKRLKKEKEPELDEDFDGFVCATNKIIDEEEPDYEPPASA